VSLDDRTATPVVTFSFGRDAGAVRAVRSALQPLFDVDRELAEDVRLVASELVSNVVLHTQGGGRLVVWADDRVRIEVHDQDPTAPVVLDVSISSITGRGLAIVSGIADRWGVERRDDGKATWAEFHRQLNLGA
jgi:anti-sigma regulatory factor (Ser/Thr protein kinase)